MPTSAGPSGLHVDLLKQPDSGHVRMRSGMTAPSCNDVVVAGRHHRATWRHSRASNAGLAPEVLGARAVRPAARAKAQHLRRNSTLPGPIGLGNSSVSLMAVLALWNRLGE